MIVLAIVGQCVRCVRLNTSWFCIKEMPCLLVFGCTTLILAVVHDIPISDDGGVWRIIREITYFVIISMSAYVTLSYLFYSMMPLIGKSDELKRQVAWPRKPDIVACIFGCLWGAGAVYLDLVNLWVVALESGPAHQN